jgi:hypothetical protein
MSATYASAHCVTLVGERHVHQAVGVHDRVSCGVDTARNAMIKGALALA